MIVDIRWGPAWSLEEMRLLLGDAAPEAYRKYGGNIRFALAPDWADGTLAAVLSRFSVQEVLVLHSNSVHGTDGLPFGPL